MRQNLQVYGHTNYASRTVTGGFYFRNPHTRSGVFRGPVVDGTPTLLVGDRVWAATGDEGAGGCPTIPIIDNAPDAAALAAVEADPNFTLHSRFPGGFTPQFGGDLIDYSVVAGLRKFSPTGLNWDASVNIGTSEVDQFIFDTVNATRRSATTRRHRSSPAATGSTTSTSMSTSRIRSAPW